MSVFPLEGISELSEISRYGPLVRKIFDIGGSHEPRNKGN